MIAFGVLGRARVKSADDFGHRPQRLRAGVPGVRLRRHHRQRRHFRRLSRHHLRPRLGRRLVGVSLSRGNLPWGFDLPALGQQQRPSLRQPLHPGVSRQPLSVGRRAHHGVLVLPAAVLLFGGAAGVRRRHVRDHAGRPFGMGARHHRRGADGLRRARRRPCGHPHRRGAGIADGGHRRRPGLHVRDRLRSGGGAAGHGR